MNHRDRRARRLLAVATVMAFAFVGALSTTPAAAAPATAASVPSAATAPSAGVTAAARTYRGVGDDVIRIRATRARGIVTVTHDGEGHFAVWALKPNGKQDDLLVNTIGEYSGTTVFNAYSWNRTGAFEITADGAWTVKVQPIAAAPLWKTATVRGRGDKVLKLRRPSRGLRTLRYRHSGDGVFIVHAYPVYGGPDLLVMKMGEVSGRVRLPAGTRYVSVKSRDTWSLTRN